MDATILLYFVSSRANITGNNILPCHHMFVSVYISIVELSKTDTQKYHARDIYPIGSFFVLYNVQMESVQTNYYVH